MKTVLLINYIVTILLYNCFPAYYKLVDSIFVERAWIFLKKVCEVVFDSFHGIKILAIQTILQRNVWRIWWVLENFPFQLLQFLQCLLGDVWPSIVVMEDEAFSIGQNRTFFSNCRIESSELFTVLVRHDCFAVSE